MATSKSKHFPVLRGNRFWSIRLTKITAKDRLYFRAGMIYGAHFVERSLAPNPMQRVRKMPVTDDQVRRSMVDMMKQHAAAKAKRDKLILYMYEIQKMSCKAIGKEVKLDSRRVGVILDDMGIKRRSPWEWRKEKARR